MGSVHLVEDTFVAVPPEAAARAFLAPACQAAWATGLELSVTWDRGVEGRQWDASGAVRGTAELWLEPVLDGVVVHWFVRGETRGRARPTVRRLLRAWRDASFRVKDELEADRDPGVKPRSVAADE